MVDTINRNLYSTFFYIAGIKLKSEYYEEMYYKDRFSCYCSNDDW